MNNELREYLSSGARYVTVGYVLPDGTKERVFRKIEGQNTEGIECAINSLRDSGIENINLEVYRRNGSAMVLTKVFTIKPHRMPSTRVSFKKETTQPKAFNPSNKTLCNMEKRVAYLAEMEAMVLRDLDKVIRNTIERQAKWDFVRELRMRADELKQFLDANDKKHIAYCSPSPFTLRKLSSLFTRCTARNKRRQ
jgi:hypothetical protein